MESAGLLVLSPYRVSPDAEVVQEPTEQPYGIRDCAFRDPAGNRCASTSSPERL